MNSLTYDRLRIHDELPFSFEKSSGGRQERSTSSFSFNFVMDEMMDDAFGGLQAADVELTNSGKPCPRFRRRPYVFVRICGTYATCAKQTGEYPNPVRHVNYYCKTGRQRFRANSCRPPRLPWQLLDEGW